MLPVVYRQAARRDIVRAAQAYESERTGLARRFVEEIARIEYHIADAPALYQTVDGEIRRAAMRRFPFGLFYVEEADRIVVLACLDLRRDPVALTDVLARR
jgi:plasmid stabilization system protein ParE